KRIDGVELNMDGMHNVENAVAATAVADQLQIDIDKIRAALKNFKGIKRRFEYIIPPSDGREQHTGNNGVVFIDDYAHHPEKLRALISSAKSLLRGLRCTIIFQPHLYSR